MKVLQLLENTFEGIRDKVNAEIEAKEESAASESSDESEEEVKTESKNRVQKGRHTIVRAKRPPVKAQKSVRDASRTPRISSVQASAKIKKNAQEMTSDNEMSDKPLIGKKRAAPF